MIKKTLAAVAALALSGAALAQAYPSKPVKLLVGFAAGGPTDVIARVIAQDLSQSLGQNVVVENKTGASGMIATQEVKRAAPDGYTLIMITLTHNVNAILMADKKPYDPINDFSMVSLVSLLPMVAVAKGDSPLRSIQDLVALAKTKPGEVSYASSGNGGSAHLAGALLEMVSSTKQTHVPFRGNAPALGEIMGGRITYMFYPMIGIADQVREKRLKALAVTTPQRHPDYPGVPTMAESGYPGFEDYTQGLGIVGPAGMPAPVVARLNAAIKESIAKPETKARLATLGAITTSSTPEEFVAFLKKDAERWQRVITAAGVKAEQQ